MRFVHTADLHFGGSTVLGEKALQRQEEAFDQIFDIAKDNNIDVVVISGDLFDVSEPEQEVRDLVQRKILEYDAAGFHILIIPGNHDLVNLSGYTALHPLVQMYKAGCLRNSVVVENTSYVRIGDTVFCLLVHNPGSFREDAEKAVFDLGNSSIESDHDHLVMVCHEAIKGSHTDVRLSNGGHYRMTSGEDAPSEELPVTYWALGDIHKRQKVRDNAYYPGAPLQIRFGDEWPKGCLVVDTDNPTRPRFAPIETNQMVKAAPDDDIPANSYVKLVVKDKTSLVTQNADHNVVKIELAKSDKGVLDIEDIDSLSDQVVARVKTLTDREDVLKVVSQEIESLGLLGH